MDSGEHIQGIDLKLRRIRAGLRQFRVARDLGISPSVLCDWENGRKPIPLRQKQRILDVIDRLSLTGELEPGDYA